jgi:hypothetical protein
MNIIQWIRSALQRPSSYLVALFKEKEELPVEHDPVGEFLESKKKGINPAEEAMGEAPLVADVAPKAVGQAIEASNENVASTEKVEAAAQAAESQLRSPIRSEVKEETSAAVLAGGKKAEDGKAEAEEEASAVPSAAKAEARVPEPVGQKVEEANTPPASRPKEEEKIESVLEVFRSEELALDTTSSLSKELGDMSVYSLLEETKQIAQIAKKVKKVSQE